MVNTIYILYHYSTDEDPTLRIENSAIINLRGVSTKLNKYKFTFICTFVLLTLSCFLCELKY